MAESQKQRRHGGGKPVIDLAGQRLGSLVVIERAEKPATRSLSPQLEAWWRGRCEACGAEAVLRSQRIRTGAWRCPCQHAADQAGRTPRALAAGSSEPWPAPVTPPTRPKPPPMPPPQPPAPTPPSPGAHADDFGR